MAAAKKQQNFPLMPKATAVWLIDNTGLTFEQIGDFCGLHKFEVQAIADGEVAMNIVGRSPLAHGEVVQAEIDKAEKNKDYRMVMAKSNLPKPKIRSKGPKYTPVSKRGDKPDAIAWILRNHPEISDAQIVKLIGTTKPTINAIRERTHANITSIKPRHPIELGLCTYEELNKASEKGIKAGGKPLVKEKPEEKAPEEMDPFEAASNFDFSNFMKD